LARKHTMLNIYRLAVLYIHSMYRVMQIWPDITVDEVRTLSFTTLFQLYQSPVKLRWVLGIKMPSKFADAAKNCSKTPQQPIKMNDGCVVSFSITRTSQCEYLHSFHAEHYSKTQPEPQHLLSQQ